MKKDKIRKIIADIVVGLFYVMFGVAILSIILGGVFWYNDNLLEGCTITGKVEIITITISFLVYVAYRIKKG